MPQSIPASVPASSPNCAFNNSLQSWRVKILPLAIGIDQDLIVARPVFHQEISGKAHAHHGQTAPPGHFDINERQGYGNANFPVQNVVEIAVPAGRRIPLRFREIAPP